MRAICLFLAVCVSFCYVPLLAAEHPKRGRMTFLEPTVFNDAHADPIVLPRDRARSLRLIETGRFAEAAALLHQITREADANAMDYLNLAGALMQIPDESEPASMILRFLLTEYDEPAAAFYLAQLTQKTDIEEANRLICKAASGISADLNPSRGSAPILRMLLADGISQLHPPCPNNCNYRGVCLPACVCMCDEGFEGIYCEHTKTKDPPHPAEPPRITVQIDGPIYGDGSFAHVNRRLIGALLRPPMRNRIRVFVNPTDQPSKTRNPWTEGDQEIDQILRECVGLRNRIPRVDFTLRHSWPPNLNPPSTGRWILFLPWEYCALPSDWIPVIRHRVDLVIVPSSFVRDCMIENGISPDRVAVLTLGGLDSAPLQSQYHDGHDIGINKAVYDPEDLFNMRSERQIPIDGLLGSKRMHFLFVGGTIHRKGIDILLDAYLAEFNSLDPVTLLIKDTGTGSHYKGQTMDKRIQALIRSNTDKSAPHILYTNAEITPRQMQDLYGWAHALIHPYRGEGFGLPIAEAMGSGVAVVVPCLGPVQDYVDPSRGYLVRATQFLYPESRIGPWETAHRPSGIQPDLQDLRDTLRRLVQNPSDVAAVGMRAADYVRSNMTWAHTAERFIRILMRNRALSIQRHSMGGSSGIYREARFFPVAQ